MKKRKVETNKRPRRKALSQVVERRLIQPRFAVRWPDGTSFHPYQRHFVKGWHCIDEVGPWSVESLFFDLRAKVLHAHWCGRPARPGKRRQWYGAVFEPQKNLLIAIAGDLPQHMLLRVWADSPDRAETEFRRLRKEYLRERPAHAESDKAEFVILTVRMGGVVPRVVSIRPNIQTAAHLAMHYGEDFLDWHVEFITQLKRRQSGLTILQGEPGVGKTSYLRHLMCELRCSHRCYFVPISSYALLASPSCVDFWLSENEQFGHLGKLVVIEDAESLLVKRGGDNQEALSNLLSSTDGFLGDFLKLHVVCTINAPIDQLDPAIIRPGRLVATRRFRRLSPAEAARIAKAGGITLKSQQSYSLGEIYNNGKSTEEIFTNGNPVGFAASARNSRNRN